MSHPSTIIRVVFLKLKHLLDEAVVTTRNNQSCDCGAESYLRELSAQARALWAKTGSGEERNLWSPLYVHMGDSACVARKLWSCWLPASVKRCISSFIEDDDEAAETLVCWLAGVHDIGKAAPGFQFKVPERAELDEEVGLRVPQGHMVPHPPSHATMGEVLLENWLDDRGWDRSDTFGCVVGAHHGAPPSSERVLDDIEDASAAFPLENLGDQDWAASQNELLEWMFRFSGMDGYENAFRERFVPQPVQVLLSALVIMADWISSNADFFPLVDCVETYDEFLVRADVGWTSLALPSAWHAEQVELEDQEFFHRRFADLPEDATLRPAQVEALHAALGMSEPGLLIIEAPMGNGKTEASLLCAEVLAARTGAGGIAYLLPTMATSNAMFNRVESWLEHVPDARGRSVQSMQLLHSKASLNREYSKLRNWNSTWMGDQNHYCTEEDVIAHQWFGGRKRGLLSSFVVGTVDQLLMAALKTRHVQLRHLGLAGKVVVIDEVHAYDAYMNTYLDRILTWLGAYGVPTILLSATLPANRRNELVHAYRGRDKKTAGRVSRRKDIPESPRDSRGCPAYPIITTAAHTGALDGGMYRVCEDHSAGTDVLVQGMEDDDAALVAQLHNLLSDGGCACVLRDTVRRAQHTYELLREEFGSSCVKLVHSRFIAIDRMANDAELLKLLGPDSTNRPKKLIVVGTQVIEQSLDIDFDVMISDLAPIDLLLQRMGRLHRHQRGNAQSLRPEKLRRAQCYLTGIENWALPLPEINRSIEAVYPRALLWKSVEALKAKRDSSGVVVVNLPHDIAGLVEQVYALDTVSDNPASNCSGKDSMEALRAAAETMRKQRKKAQGRAQAWLLGKPQKAGKSLVGWLRDSYSPTDDAKARAAVRDSGESVEVVAIQENDGKLELLPWVASSESGCALCRSLGDGSDVPDDAVARMAANCTVSLPPLLSAPWNYEHVIDALEARTQVTGWQESRWLRGQLPLVLDSSLNCSIETDRCVFRLHYSREMGLQVVDQIRKGEDER